MTDQGFIKLYRSILKWEWWTDEKTTRVFLWLLLNANWEDSRFREHQIPKGSLVVGRKKMAKELKMSEQSIRTSIEHLKSTNEITTYSTNKFTIISIVNWEKYQGVENKSTNKPTNNQPTTNHIKEYKEIKNKEYFNKSSYQNGRNPDFIAKLEMETQNGKH